MNVEFKETQKIRLATSLRSNNIENKHIINFVSRKINPGNMSLKL